MVDVEDAVDPLVELFKAVAKSWKRGDLDDEAKRGARAYMRFSRFDTAERVRRDLRIYANFLSCIESFEDSVGCDLGCWLGFSTALQGALGCRAVYGVDIRDLVVRTAAGWSQRFGVDNLHFRLLRDGVVPLGGNTVDWVVINQVLCNAPPDTFQPSLSEAYRILKPGGTLILCDGNNPYCAKTEVRLKRDFLAAEVGDGTIEEPNGLNYNARQVMISQAASQLSPARVARLARETCYLWGEEVESAARRFAATGESPGSVFDPDSLRTPLLPKDGAANGNPTDPFELCGQMESLGFGNIDITQVGERRSLDNELLWSAVLTKLMRFVIFADKLA